MGSNLARSKVDMASLKRIAADLGVSYSLVSKVLSGKLGTTGVSASTRVAIQKRALELDYRPNRLAVALKAQRNGGIGIFLHRIGSPGSDVSDRLLEGMATQLEESGLRMWLRFFLLDEEFLRACDMRLKSEIDGLIVAGVFHTGLVSKLLDLERQGVPVVGFFNDIPPRAKRVLTFIEVDLEAQGYLPTKHLLDHGCRRLVCFRTREPRTAGFFKAHREAKVKVDPNLVIPTSNYFFEDGVESVGKLLAMKLPFDGIVCQSDAQAHAVINELVRRGFKVPGEIKVTGVDNSALAKSCIVPITSVTSEMRRAGIAAVEILLQKMAGKSAKSIKISPQLIERQSSCLKLE